MKAANGGTINIKDLGLGELSEIIETMDENGKALEEMEKPWEQKLSEEKEKDKEKMMNPETNAKGDRRGPHLTNLNEDP
jgi:hypothetical protein